MCNDKIISHKTLLSEEDGKTLGFLQILAFRVC